MDNKNKLKPFSLPIPHNPITDAEIVALYSGYNNLVKIVADLQERLDKAEKEIDLLTGY